MQDKLRQEKELLEITLESIGDAVIAADQKANILKMNHIAEELCGWSRQDALGRPLDDVFQTVDAKTGQLLENPFRQTLEQGLSIGLKKDSLLLSRDGSRRYASANSSPIRNKQGSIVGIVVVFRDITRIRQIEESLKEAKEAAEAANRAKDEFLANMSHEIRTPLNGIIGMTTLTLLSELNPEQKENLSIIKMSGDSLLNIINDILDFSKIEAGKMSIEATSFDLRELLSKNLGLHLVFAEEKGLQLEYEIDDEIPRLLIGDPYRIQQVLINLISNALKFTENGKICVSAAIHEKQDVDLWLQISVSDTGIGIASEQMNKLFKSFTQLDGSITRNYGGTGLGLYISKQLVNMMGGEIWAESIPGQGSTFNFTVKLGIAYERQGTNLNKTLNSESSLPKTKKPLYILLVEDDKTNQLVIANLLKTRGHMVETVNNGREALQIWEQRNLDLILMDIMMPEMDGLEATRQIRREEVKTGKHIRIIAVTAHPAFCDREKVLAAGMDDYVAKPLQMDKLLQVVEKTQEPTAEHTCKDYLPPQNPGQDDDDFAVKLEEYLRPLRSALNSLNMSNLESYAHKIKELAYTRDEIAIKNLAFKVELLARKADIAQLCDYVQKLEEKCRQYKDCL